MRYGSVLLILLCCFMWLPGAVYGRNDTPSRKKIVIADFDVSAAGKYSYLQHGVQSMLVSRLAAIDGGEVLDYTISEEELANLKDSSKKSGALPVGVEADYLVTGALFSLKKGLNIQITFYPLSREGEIEHFSSTAESDALIISQVDKLSQDIAAKVFGRKKPAPDPLNTGKDTEGTSGFTTIHPEIAYKRGLYSGSVAGVGDSAIKVSTEGVRRTGEVAAEMTAMAVGDLDGDGRTEIVLLSERELRILQFVGRELRELARTRLAGDIKVHAVAVADIDSSGKMEIYLSATEELSVSSLIMEWDKTDGFSTIKENIAWYLRPLRHPDRGLILAGQQRGVERTDLVKKGVYQLFKKADNSFAAGTEIVLPKSVNLFDFAYADIDGDKTAETIAIDQNQKLRIYDQENGLLWISSEDYGGSKTYIGPRQGSATDRHGTTSTLSVDENSERELIYVPKKIVVVDLDKNGRQDVVVVNNVVSSFRYFTKLRMYDGGSVVGLTWNGSALVETWRTGRQSGYIADFDFSLNADPAADSKVGEGAASLYIGQIPTSGTLESLIPGSTYSKLTLFELGFSQKN